MALITIREAYGEAFERYVHHAQNNSRYYNETLSLCHRLKDNGFVFIYVDDGEALIEANSPEEAAIIINNVDEARLYVKDRDGNQFGLFIILGNSPGELVADYHVNPLLEIVMDEHENQWFK